MENIKLAKIKDFILEVLKGTIIGTKPLKKEEFLKEIYSRKHIGENVDLMLKYLIDNGYVRSWDSGGDVGWVYAIEDKGKIKIEEGGFNKGWFRKHITPTHQILAIIVATIAIVSSTYGFGHWMNWW